MISNSGQVQVLIDKLENYPCLCLFLSLRECFFLRLSTCKREDIFKISKNSQRSQPQSKPRKQDVIDKWSCLELNSFPVSFPVIPFLLPKADNRNKNAKDTNSAEHMIFLVFENLHKHLFEIKLGTENSSGKFKYYSCCMCIHLSLPAQDV